MPQPFSKSALKELRANTQKGGTKKKKKNAQVLFFFKRSQGPIVLLNSTVKMRSHLHRKEGKTVPPVGDPERDYFFIFYFFPFYPKYPQNSPGRERALRSRSPSGSRRQATAAAPFPAGPVPAARPPPARPPQGPQRGPPRAPGPRGAPHLGSRPAAPVGCRRARQQGPARRPSCSRAQGHVGSPPKDKGQ